MPKLREELLKEALFQNEKKRYRPAGDVAPNVERIAHDLAEDGLSLHQAPQPMIKAIWDDVGQYRPRLTDQSARNGGMNCALALPHAGRFWNEVAAYLEQSGILAGCSARTPTVLEACDLALWCCRTRAKSGGAAATIRGIPTAQTVYMHNDKDYDIMKVLVYLSDVKEPQGPFCFVRGSHRWLRSKTQSFFHKSFDAAANVNLAPREPQRTIYYRKAFRHPEFRRQFLMLPASAARIEPFRR